MAEEIPRTDDTRTTTDHETIREWVEGRGSTAAQVTEPAGNDPGSLAIIPVGKMDDSVRDLPWEEFFEIFEEEKLAFVHRTERDDPKEQWFCAFIERGEIAVSTDEPDTTESEGRKTLGKLEGKKTG